MTYHPFLVIGMVILLASGLGSAAAPFWVHWIGKRAWLHSFSVMTQAWGAINAVIALFGLVPLLRDTAVSTSQARTYQHTLAINAGLDLVYLAIGIVLIYTGTKKPNQQLVGFGWAIVAQAILLFMIDAVLALIGLRFI